MNKNLIKKAATVIAAVMSFSVVGSAAEMTPSELFQKVYEATLKNDSATVNNLIFVDTHDNFEVSVDAKIVINENEVLHEIDELMLGAQCEIGGLGKVVLEPGSTELTTDYKNFAKDWFKCPVYRWGGASAEVFNPIKNIGPFEKRGTSFYEETSSFPTKIGSVSASPSTMGPIEFVKYVYANNPDAEIIMCVPMNAATPEDNKNLAAFLTHRADESEWGALRASYGLVEPVKIFAWELGNEIYAALRHEDETLAWYPPVAKANMNAIREVDPDAKFALCGIGCPWSYTDDEYPKWREWTVKLLEDLVALGETQFDYMTYHPYYDGVYTPQHEIYHQQYSEDVAKVLGEDNTLEFLLTEHSTWTDPLGSGKLQSLSHALSVAQFMNRMYHYDNIAGATYHNITGDGLMWALYRPIDGKLQETLVSKMYRTYQMGVGDRLVKHEITSDHQSTDLTSRDYRFTVMASAEGDRQLNLILCNDYRNGGAEYNLTFEFENNYTLKEETIFTAPNLASLVYDKKSIDIGTITTTEKNEKNFSTYHVPPHSLVVLKLESDKDIPQYGEKTGGDVEEVIAEDIETGFVDIEDCWAKNEIAKMADMGIVNGKSETEFVPYANITRGEFAAMICRMLDFDTDYKESRFKDVANDAWYMPYINATQVERVLKGDDDNKFRPDDNITLEEMIVASERICKKYGKSATGVNVDNILSQFKYSGNISAWARNDIASAAKSGIIYRLYENGNLDILKNATRAETVSVLYRVYNLVK